MKKLLFIITLGLAIFTPSWSLICLAASPDENGAITPKTQVMDIENTPAETKSTSGEADLEKNMMQSTAPTNPNKKYVASPLQFFYSDTQSLSVYLGAAYSSQPAVVYGLGGFSYMLPSQNRFHLEAAFDSLGAQEAHFRLMAKWYSGIAGKIRSYYNLGLGLRMLSNDNLVVILSWTRFFLQAGGGLEWSFTQNLSLRAEAFTAGDLNSNAYLGLLAGISIGF